jgi:MFS family permease
VGVAGLLPLIVFGLYGGAVADAVDRRTLVLVTTTGQLLLAVVLVVQAALDVGSVGLLYLVVAGQAAFSAVDSPARQAFVPRLLRKELLPAANALKLTEFNLAVTIGPLLAGVLVANLGYEAAYGLDALTFLVALAVVARLPSMPPEGGGRRAGTKSVLEGLAFLRTRQVLLMTFVVDLVAMVFGMPRALFPALAEEVYGGGEQTAALLYSALAAGGLLGALFSGWFGRVHRQGWRCWPPSPCGEWRSRCSASATCCGWAWCSSPRPAPPTWCRPRSGPRSCRPRLRTRCAAGSAACSSWSWPAAPASGTPARVAAPSWWGCRARRWPAA